MLFGFWKKSFNTYPIWSLDLLLLDFFSWILNLGLDSWCFILKSWINHLGFWHHQNCLVHHHEACFYNPLQASYPRHILGREAPSSMDYSLVDGASPHLFAFIFRCISMVENHHWRTSLKLKNPASIEASQASFHHVLLKPLLTSIVVSSFFSCFFV